MMQPRPTQTKPNTWKRGGWKWVQGRRCRFQRGWGLARTQKAKGIPPYPLPWWRWTQLGRLSVDLIWELLEIWRDLNIILSSPWVLLLLMSSTIIVQVNLGTIMRKESWRAEILDSMRLSSEASLPWRKDLFSGVRPSLPQLRFRGSLFEVFWLAPKPIFPEVRCITTCIHPWSDWSMTPKGQPEVTKKWD